MQISRGLIKRKKKQRRIVLLPILPVLKDDLTEQ